MIAVSVTDGIVRDCLRDDYIARDRSPVTLSLLAALAPLP